METTSNVQEELMELEVEDLLERMMRAIVAGDEEVVLACKEELRRRRKTFISEIDHVRRRRFA
jgi:hypothetical protein